MRYKRPTNQPTPHTAYSRYKSVLGIDPGGNTGTAYIEVDLEKTHIRVLHLGVSEEWQGLDAILAKHKPLEVVYEKFLLSGPGVNPIALEVIGVLKYVLTRDYPTVLLFSHTPGARMFIDRRYPNFRPYLSSHWGDALRHALLFVIKRYDLHEFSLEFANQPNGDIIQLDTRGNTGVLS